MAEHQLYRCVYRWTHILDILSCVGLQYMYIKCSMCTVAHAYISVCVCACTAYTGCVPSFLLSVDGNQRDRERSPRASLHWTISWQDEKRLYNETKRQGGRMGGKEEWMTWWREEGEKDGATKKGDVGMNQARGHVNLISDCEPFKSLLWVLFTCSSGVLSVEVEVEKRHLPSTCPISLFNLIPVVRVDNQNPSLTLKESPLISFFCTVLMWSAWSQNVYKR